MEQPLFKPTGITLRKIHAEYANRFYNFKGYPDVKRVGDLKPIRWLNPNFGKGTQLYIEVDTCGLCNGTGRNTLKQLRTLTGKRVKFCPKCQGAGKHPRGRPDSDFWIHTPPPERNLTKTHRPHLTYTLGNVGKLRRGELPELRRVDLYSMVIWLDRPHARLKSVIMKALLSFVENLLAS